MGNAEDWRAFLAPIPDQGTTLRAWADRQLARAEQEGSKSVRETRSVYRLIGDTLGEIELGELTQREVVAWIRWLASRKKPDGTGRWAPKTVRKFHSFLRSLLQKAVAEGLIPQNPAKDLPRGVLPPDKPRPEFDPAAEVLRAHEAGRLISDQRLPLRRRALYAAALFTGAREGELLGLKWGDLRREVTPLGRLRIERQYSDKRKSFDETKTGDPKDVPVHPVLDELLIEWKAAYEEAMEAPISPSRLIFPRRWRGRLRPQIQNQVLTVFKRDLQALGLPTRRFHALRHTFVSLAVDAGADPDVVFAITHRGGASIRETYRHWQWSRLCAEIEKVPIQRFRPMQQLGLI